MDVNPTSVSNTQEKLVLKLFVTGMSGKSMMAIENLKRFCTEYIKDGYELEIIDIYKNPELISQEQIIFSPSLVKSSPSPRKLLVGTLSDTGKLIKILGIKTT